MTDEGDRLVVPPRRAYGVGAAGRGEDYVTATEDVARLLGDGAHLVGNSYGALVAMLVAAARPDAVRSLTLVEQPATRAAAGDADVALFRAALERASAGTGSDWEFLQDFLRAVGATAEAFPTGDAYQGQRRCQIANRSAHVFDTEPVTSSEYQNVVKPDKVPTGGMGAIPVIARLVCADGVEEWWPARAVRWTTTDVLIGFEAEPGDHQSLRYLWLRVDDVARVIRPGPAATER